MGSVSSEEPLPIETHLSGHAHTAAVIVVLTDFSDWQNTWQISHHFGGSGGAGGGPVENLETLSQGVFPGGASQSKIGRVEYDSAADKPAGALLDCSGSM